MKSKKGTTDLILSDAPEGYAVDSAGAALSAGTARPYNYILDAEAPGGYRNAVPQNCPDEIELQLAASAGSISKGTLLQLHTDGTVKADTGTGARVVVAEAREAKAADGQLIKVRLLGTALLYAS